MDILWQSCIDNIALSGAAGCSLDEVWASVSSDLKKELDKYTRLWIWKEIRKRAHASTNPRQRLFFFYSKKGAKLTASPAGEGIGLRDAHRREIPDDELPLMLEDAQSFGSAECGHLRVVASEYARFSALGILDPDISLGSVSYAILEAVGASKRLGVVQVDLATKLSTNSKTVFHHLKKLENYRLIVRRSIFCKRSNGPSTRTNIVLLPRFEGYLSLKQVEDFGQEEQQREEEQETVYLYSDIAMRVCTLLASARNCVLREVDLKRVSAGISSSQKLNAIWCVVRKMLEDQGLVSVFSAKIPGVNGKDQIFKCVKLIKYPSSQKEIESHSKYSTNVPTHRLVMEFPVDYQLWRIIDGAGSVGVIQSDLRPYALSRRMITKKIEGLVHIRKLVKALACNVNSGKNMSFILKSANYVQSGPEDISTTADCDPKFDCSQPTLKAPADDTTDTSDVFPSNPRRKHSNKVYTVQYNSRKSVILSSLEKFKLLVVSNVRKLLQDSENELHGCSESEHSIDHKTVRKIIQDIVESGLGKLLVTNVYNAGVLKKVTVLVKNGTTDSEWQSMLCDMPVKSLISRPTSHPPSKNDPVIQLDSVEHLSDSQMRVSSAPPCVDNKNSGEPKEQATNEVETVSETGLDMTGVHVAIQLGLEKALMRRARTLHTWLCLYFFENRSAKPKDTARSAGEVDADSSVGLVMGDIPGSGVALGHQGDNPQEVKLFLNSVMDTKQPNDKAWQKLIFRGESKFANTADQSDDVLGLAKEKWYQGPEFNLESVFLDMPAHIFCKAIGVLKIVPGIGAAVKSGALIRDLDVVSQKMILKRSHYRRRLNKIITILRSLNLVSPKITVWKRPVMDEREFANIEEPELPQVSMLSLNPVGLIWYSSSAEGERCQIFQMDDQQELQTYWNVLECASRKKIQEMAARTEAESVSEVREEPLLVRAFPKVPGLPKFCLVESMWSGVSSRKGCVQTLREAWESVRTEADLDSCEDPTPTMLKLAKDLQLAPENVLRFYKRYKNRKNGKRQRPEIAALIGDGSRGTYKRSAHGDGKARKGEVASAVTDKSLRPICIKLPSRHANVHARRRADQLALEEQKLEEQTDDEDGMNGNYEEDEEAYQLATKRSGRWTQLQNALFLRQFIEKKAQNRCYLDDVNKLWDGIDKEVLAGYANRSVELLEKRMRQIVSDKANLYQLSNLIAQAIRDLEEKEENSEKKQDEGQSDTTSTFRLPASIEYIQKNYYVSYDLSLKGAHSFMLSELGTLASTVDSQTSPEDGDDDFFSTYSPLKEEEKIRDKARLSDGLRHDQAVPAKAGTIAEEKTLSCCYFFNYLCDSASCLPPTASSWMQDAEYDMVLADYIKMALILEARGADPKTVIQLISKAFSHEEAVNCFIALRRGHVLTMTKSLGTRKFRVAQHLMQNLKEGEYLVNLAKTSQAHKKKIAQERLGPSSCLKPKEHSELTSDARKRPETDECGDDRSEARPVDDPLLLKNWKVMFDPFSPGGHVASILECTEEQSLVLEPVRNSRQKLNSNSKKISARYNANDHNSSRGNYPQESSAARDQIFSSESGADDVAVNYFWWREHDIYNRYDPSKVDYSLTSYPKCFKHQNLLFSGADTNASDHLSSNASSQTLSACNSHFERHKEEPPVGPSEYTEIDADDQRSPVDASLLNPTLWNTFLCYYAFDTDLDSKFYHTIWQLVEQSKQDSIDIYHLEWQLASSKKTAQTLHSDSTTKDQENWFLWPFSMTQKIHTALCRLESFHFVQRVLGPFSEAWVTASHLTRWTVQPTDNECQAVTPLNPWTAFDCSSPDNDFLHLLKATVAMFVIKSPGIDEERVIEKLQLFRPSVVMELLKLLLLDNAVSVKYLAYRPFNLSDVTKYDGSKQYQSSESVRLASEEEYHHYLSKRFYRAYTKKNISVPEEIVQKCFWPEKNIYSAL